MLFYIVLTAAQDTSHPWLLFSYTLFTH